MRTGAATAVRRIGASIVVALLFTCAASAAALAAPERADVVVVGGGPTGLAAAIEARKNGAERVVVLEKRAQVRPRRPQMLVIRQGAMDILAHAGVDTASPDFVPIERLEQFGVDGTRLRDEPVPKHRPDAARASESPELTTSERAALIPIGTLEGHLERAAAAVGGIEIRNEVEVVALSRRSGTATVAATHRGARVTVEADLAVVADGAHSGALSSLGIEPARDRSRKARLIAGTVRARNARTGSLSIYNRRQGKAVVQTYVLGGSQTGLLIEVPDGVELTDRKAIERYFAREARAVGVEGEIAAAPTLFDVDLQQAGELNLGPEIAVVGDAARTTHVFTGLGVNTGLHDSLRLGLLFKKLRNAPTQLQKRAAMAWYARQTARATRINHGQARPLFEAELSRRTPPQRRRLFRPFRAGSRRARLRRARKVRRNSTSRRKQLRSLRPKRSLRRKR